MRHTRSRGAAALLLALGAGAAALVPTAQAATGAGAGAPEMSPGLVQAMQRDLHLTKSEAEQRLAQERLATAVDQRARSIAGRSYAGSWFDARTGRLTVASTDPSLAGRLRAAGADVRRAEYSAARLDAVKKQLDQAGAPGGVAAWRVDPKVNRVVVDVISSHRSDNDVKAFVRKAVKAGPVQVREVGTAPRTFAAGTVGGDPYYTGNVRCSIGFSVQGGFVTAGHCGQPGAAVYGWDRTPVGSFQGSSFPDNDYAWVSVGNGWWTVPVVLGWGTVPDQLVRGSNEAPVGASICRSGSTTHWHCGTVLAKNETVNYSQGAVHQLTKTSVCAEPGDSGGSFISGDQAQGVTSGGWGNCSSGGETWFQPVNEILNRYGLRLHTA
ncbi:MULTISPECIES: S1 family peptidase [Streptomyces]|uniref:Serine protease n=2 Tax=Streptomyces TaxID=1883 RepID=A0A2U9NVM3_STRAS|nr:S1 family peptidase [Streptomyces actuosus]AWT41154.1 serine protease [Streptomyces actuosus]MBM4826331.1 S1 family peptidase [Streptomyces actuosus]